jgi:L-threonylcarbamoyladenylate synthase
VERVPPDATGLKRAAEALRRGEVVAYPTDTVYGLGVDPANHEALNRLFELKGRERNRAVILIAYSVEQLEDYTGKLPARAAALAKQFWPGPLSLLVPPIAGVEPLLLGASGKLCVRVPALAAARELCAAFGGAITSTSANVSGAAPALNAEDAALSGVAVVVDAGILATSKASTVYDPDERKILREGAVSVDELRAFEHEWNG